MEVKVRLVNGAGTPITIADFNSSKLETELLGLNGRGGKEGMELKSTPFRNGVASLEYPSVDELKGQFSELKTLTFRIEIVEGPGFYQENSISYKVSLDCGKDPRYVDYDALLAKLADERKTLDKQLAAAKEAGDDALIAKIKDQLVKLDDEQKELDDRKKKQEEAGIEPTVCTLEGFPTKVSLPLKQITRTPQQQEERREDINSELVASAIKKLAPAEPPRNK